MCHITYIRHVNNKGLKLNQWFQELTIHQNNLESY